MICPWKYTRKAEIRHRVLPRVCSKYQTTLCLLYWPRWCLWHLQKIYVQALDIKLILCQQWNNLPPYFSNSVFSRGLSQTYNCTWPILWNQQECWDFCRIVSSAYLLLSCIQFLNKLEIYVRASNFAIKILNVLWLIQNICLFPIIINVPLLPSLQILGLISPSAESIHFPLALAALGTVRVLFCSTEINANTAISFSDNVC